MSEVDALQQALAVEHEVVYAYAAAGARLGSTLRALALHAYDGHRAARDRLVELVSARHVQPVAAAPAYDIARDTADPTSAVRLLVRLEEACAAAYAQLLGATDDAALRRIGVAALTTAASAAASWRHAVSPGTPPSVAFPGLVVPGQGS